MYPACSNFCICTLIFPEVALVTSFICEKVVTQLRTIEVYPRDISTRRIVLDSLSDDNIAAVVKTLVNAQADIYAVERKTETLEDIFLNLTKEM